MQRRRRVSSATVICLEAYDCEEGEQQKGMNPCHVRQHENGYTVMECNWKWIEMVYMDRFQEQFKVFKSSFPNRLLWCREALFLKDPVQDFVL